MTLAAQFVRFVEPDQDPAYQAQVVPVGRVVAVEAPALFRTVIQDDVVVHVHEFTALHIGFQVGMTIRAGEDVVIGKRWGRNGEDAGLLFSGGLFDMGLQFHLEVDFRKVRRPVRDPALGFRVDVILPAMQKRHQRDHRQRPEDRQHDN